jgi:hypothetical protein
LESMPLSANASGREADQGGGGPSSQALTSKRNLIFPAMTFA